MKLTLDALQILDAIAQKGSFAAAAQVLHRVPSTVTYSMQKLEDDLGFIIFRREGRRSVLTPAGQVLLKQGRGVLLAAQEAVESAYQVSTGWESTLNIAIDTVWDIETFYPLVKQFQQLHTGVQLNISHEVMGGSLEALIEQRVDLVVGGPPPVTPIQGVKFIELLPTDWIFVVAGDHPLLQGSLPLSQASIQPYSWVVIKDSSRASAILPHRIHEKQRIMRVDSMEHKIQAIVQGVGVGFVARHKVEKRLLTGELVALETQQAVDKTMQFASWRTNNKGKALRWFIDKLVTYIEENPR